MERNSPKKHLEHADEISLAETANSGNARMVSAIVLGASLLAVLFIISRNNYLLFHTLAEFFSITIAWSLFVVVWNSRHLAANKAFIFIGVAYFFIGSFDLVHTLSYKGMGVIAEDWGANPATQLWIAARFMESTSLFIFPLIFFKDLRVHIVFVVYSVITALVLITIFYWRIFPDCFVDGVGLTVFKKTAEYVICFILLAAWILLRTKKHRLNPIVYRLMAYSIALTVLGELSFTFYVSVYGISNMVGHYFKILSFFLIYRALVRTSLKEPYETLFRELDTSEKKFKSLFEEMVSGAALHEIICDADGTPIDYRFLDLNSAFEEITGLKEKDLIDKTVLEVQPNTEQFWIETFGQVALTGNSVQFDNYSRELKKYLEINAYCPKHGQFVTIFNDITNRRNSEIEKDRLIDELQQATDEIKTLRGILPICSHCKKIRDDKGYWNQIEKYIHEHTEAEFSHGICQECAKEYYPDMDLYDD